MNLAASRSGSESSSETRRTRAVDPNPSQLDAEQAAEHPGPLDVTQRPAVRMDEGCAAAHRDSGSKVDTATGEGLWSAGQALAPSLGY